MAIPTKRHERNTSATSISTRSKRCSPPRPQHLARTPRPHAAPAHDPDRRACLRARQPSRARCPPRHRRPLSGHGQGPQEARNDPDRRDRHDPTRMAEGTPTPSPTSPLFPTRQGQPLSRYTIGAVVAKHAAIAAASCPSLAAKRVTPHTLRHTNAMLLRAKGVDIATIALWLGHESTQTTHIYEHADPALKEEAIARTAPLGAKPGRYRPSDTRRQEICVGGWTCLKSKLWVEGVISWVSSCGVRHAVTEVDLERQQRCRPAPRPGPLWGCVLQGEVDELASGVL